MQEINEVIDRDNSTMMCSRCGGLMVERTVFDLPSLEEADVLCCLNCGNMEDSLILRNRRKRKKVVQCLK